MTTNELMLGDWVSYKGKMPCKITAICKDTAVVDNDTTQDWRIDYDNLTPIPLTKEILEKNGWRREPMDCDREARNEFWKSDCDWIIWNYEESFMITRTEDFVGWGFILNYVHQLQNALKLCGIDKEIEL